MDSPCLFILLGVVIVLYLQRITVSVVGNERNSRHPARCWRTQKIRKHAGDSGIFIARIQNRFLSFPLLAGNKLSECFINKQKVLIDLHNSFNIDYEMITTSALGLEICERLVSEV